MSAVVMDCKSLAAKIKTEVKDEINKTGIIPELAIIKVGNDPASDTYVRGKVKDCEECGIQCFVKTLPDDAPEKQLGVEVYNACFRDGVIVQLPLPSHIDQGFILRHIDTTTDVDCLHPANIGYLVNNDQPIPPCTPAGIMRLLEEYNIPVVGKHCVIIGRSSIVGKPLSHMMLNADATVTVCHSKTEHLADITRTADILVVAVGKPNLVTADMVKPGAVVVDVGINRGEDGKLCGDVDFQSVKEVAGYITPVPGGVGLLTRAMLMKNVVTSANL